MKDNKEKIKKFQLKLTKFFRGLDNKFLIRNALLHYATQIIPVIPLEDGGYSRGVFAGIMKQFRIEIPTDLLHKRNDIEGEIIEKEVAKGIKKGLSLSTNLKGLELPIHYGNADRYKLIKILTEKGALKKTVMQKIVEKWKKEE